jgi:hypothetical protein
VILDFGVLGSSRSFMVRCEGDWGVFGDFSGGAAAADSNGKPFWALPGADGGVFEGRRPALSSLSEIHSLCLSAQQDIRCMYAHIHLLRAGRGSRRSRAGARKYCEQERGQEQQCRQR